MRILILFLAFCAAVPIQAWSEVLTWNCSFDHRVDEDGVESEKMSLVFKVDTISGKAYMEGNAGIVEVSFYIGDEAFSFSEKVGSGAVQTTTVTRNGNVVHSRNTVILGEIVAAQHFGSCDF